MTVTVEALRDALTALDRAVAGLVVGRGSLTASYGFRTGRSSAEHAPLPIDVYALDKKVAAHRFLMDRALKTAMETDTPLNGRDVHSLTNYLFTHAPYLAEQPGAGELLETLHHHTRQCNGVQERREPKVFAGRCAECETDLYAVKGQPEARCGTCNATYEVVAWRAYAQTAKDYYISSPADLSRKLSAPEYGMTVTADQIRKWASRKVVTRPDGTKVARLQRANPEYDDQGWPIPPCYRLGDVLDLAQQQRRTPLEGRTA